MSRLRYVVLTFVIGAFLFGWAVQAACVSIFAQFQFPDNRVLGLVATSTLLGLVASVVGLVLALRHREAKQFTEEVIAELARVTWPSREETLQATYTVIATTLFVALLLSVYDVVFSRLAAFFLFNAG